MPNNLKAGLSGQLGFPPDFHEDSTEGAALFEREKSARSWIEPKSSRLLKQVETFSLPTGFNGTRTTTYSKFVLNADIPDEKFKLPEEKK